MAAAAAEGTAPVATGSEDPKVIFARAIRPGRPEPDKYPAGMKPSSRELIAEVLRRNGTATPANWSRTKLVTFLFINKPTDADNDTTIAQADALLAPKPKSASAAAGENREVQEQRWDRNRDLPRLTNCIVKHKEDFIARDETVTRQAIQEHKGAAKKQHWVSIVVSFNDAATAFDGTDEQLLHDVTDLQPGHGLSALYTGYVLTVDKAIDEFKKNIRKPLEDAKGKWNVSGGGDDRTGNDDEEEDSGDDADHSTVDRRTASFVYSSNFMDFLNKPKSATKEWHLVYAYWLFTKYDLFKSALSDMPAESSSSSSAPGTTLGGGKGKKKQLVDKVGQLVDSLISSDGSPSSSSSSSSSAIKETHLKCKTITSITMQLNDTEKDMEVLEAGDKTDTPRYKRLKKTNAYLQEQYDSLTSTLAGGN